MLNTVTLSKTPNKHDLCLDHRHSLHLRDRLDRGGGVLFRQLAEERLFTFDAVAGNGRFVLIVLVLITLNQPEFTQEIKPEEQPTLVVLHDSWEYADSGRHQSSGFPPKNRQTAPDAVDSAIKPELYVRSKAG